jgi:hypothetical protein
MVWLPAGAHYARGQVPVSKVGRGGAAKNVDVTSRRVAYVYDDRVGHLVRVLVCGVRAVRLGSGRSRNGDPG